tara:strand:+ start:278 stop:1090 length:813 start_codon:yes stop_codon:yes gene_type:complete
MKNYEKVKNEFNYKINNLSKKLLISVPYRDRENQYKAFLGHMKTYFLNDKFDNNITVRICFIEQSNLKPFNLGSLNNIGFLTNEDYLDYIVINNVDFLPIFSDFTYSENPMLLIKYGYNNLPMKPSNRNSKNIIKAPSREFVFLGSVLIPKKIFKKVNGYSNSYWGWGFEDSDMRKRLETMNIKIKYRDGLYQPLIHDNLGYEVDENNNSKLSEVHINNQKLFNEKWQDKNNFLNDGINNFNYKILTKENIFSQSRNNSLFEIYHIKVDF